MKDQITLQVELTASGLLTALRAYVYNKVGEQAGRLAAYYSRTAETEVSPGRALRILHAQIAFCCMLMPANVGLCLRALLAAWFLAALLSCRKSD